MKKTDNYSLPQWEKQDFIKMEDFNDAFGSIEQALKANADATATGLNAEIAARGEAVAAEAENRSAALAALSKNLGAAGHNCRVKWGTYTGTDTVGAENPTTLDCGFAPVLAIICAPPSNYNAVLPTVLFRPYTKVSLGRSASNTAEFLELSWGDTSLSWYSSGSRPAAQFNSGDTVYSYVVFGYDKTAEDA